MASPALSVRVSHEIDKYVRSLPNRAEWLRKAITDAYERDKSVTE